MKCSTIEITFLSKRIIAFLFTMVGARASPDGGQNFLTNRHRSRIPNVLCTPAFVDASVQSFPGNYRTLDAFS